jgi:hypothetical protein
MTYSSFGGIEKTEMVLALVVPSTSYNIDVPVLIATNVLGSVVCNSLHDSKLVRTTRPEVIPPN